MLAQKPFTFTDIQESLRINSAHLSYHINAMRELLSQTEDGRYFPSTFGDATLSLMHGVEENEYLHRGKQSREKVGIGLLLLAVMLLVVSCPAFLFSLVAGPFFPVYSVVVEPLGMSDQTASVEHGSFSLYCVKESSAFYSSESAGSVFLGSNNEDASYCVGFTTKMEITTRWLILDPSRVFQVGYYWLSSEEKGFQDGDYVTTFVYTEDKAPHSVIEKTCGYRSVRSDARPRSRTMPMRELEFSMPYVTPSRQDKIVGIQYYIPPWVEDVGMGNARDRGITLPRAYRNEYVFRLTIYTNSTVEPDVMPISLVLVRKESPFIGSLRIDSLTIGGCAVLLSFALLMTALRTGTRIL